MSTENTVLPPKFVNPKNVIEYPIIEGCEFGTYGLLIIETAIEEKTKTTLCIFKNVKDAEKARKSLQKAISEEVDSWYLLSNVNNFIDIFII